MVISLTKVITQRQSTTFIDYYDLKSEVSTMFFYFASLLQTEVYSVVQVEKVTL